MKTFILRRIFLIIPLLFLISIISFVIILLPPGSYVETYVSRLEQQGQRVDQGEIDALYRMYGLDKPPMVQYFLWMKNFITKGEMGRSFLHQRPVVDVILERLPKTLGITFAALMITWILAIPIGIYSAIRQYSIGDYVITSISFIGIALPNFLLALVLAYVAFSFTGNAISGLFSENFKNAPWSFDKFMDLMSNIWLPLLVISVSGTAVLIRILRATLLDEKNKQYVTTARAKGLSEFKLLLKYPVRVALNPLISTIGWTLPVLVSGEIIVSQVLGLETLGPVLLAAALEEDMYLVGSIVMILSTLTVLGTLISDILLAWLDPRIRYDEAKK